MSASTILTMANLKGIDLLNVRAGDLHWPTLAEHLAKENRFNGATPDVTYCVAQHLCIGTDAIQNAGGTDYEAAEFLIHDVPEAFWKDDPTPKKQAIAGRIEARCGVTADSVLGVLKDIDREHEMAVHEAAGLPWPVPEEIHRVVKLYDAKMFVTEWRDLMKNAAHPNWSPYMGVEPLPMIIDPWPWSMARASLLMRFNKLLPALRRSPA